jgi:RHH-type proline utilization regulon transcriptional repressor/proline dehydrogenase/delta 1-pyrroline-5-carboxylate dehydrogenase
VKAKARDDRDAPLMTHSPFARFAPPVRPPSPLRAAITAAYRRPEPECLAPLIAAATLAPDDSAAVRETARALTAALRGKRRGTGVEALVQEYALSSQEGVALMCLAEALLRIPDDATRDALIRDKLAEGDWKAHVGGGRSLFVNAATWGLVVTGRLVDSIDERGLAAALARLIARAGEPVIRHAVDLAMRMMGEQFVTGETIAEALRRARAMEARGFTYSYDMLGEAAATAADAARYLASYEAAIHAIGRASARRGIYEGAGISIKLSALHPRYARAQAERVMRELLPRVKALAVLAKSHDIGLNIDAEEADRLELSLDLLESLALDPDLAGWNGLGFVVQAYGKRCPFVIDWLVDLARRAGRRIMVRLVKGAYWDAEIKRAQVDGLAGFPVYTRKVHTDVAYIACARQLLAARGAVFPQFATHNAQTLASIDHMAGPGFAPGDYEFQCLHGMGEPLYEEVVGPAHLDRPCRIYAPVGSHETLLPYLVRRLLENGANSSFVHRLGDRAVPLDALLADPVAVAGAMAEPGAPHEAITLPADILGARRNSVGIDLTDESALASLAGDLVRSAATDWRARPLVPGLETAERAPRPVRNPADHRDVVGAVAFADADDVARAAGIAADAGDWGALPTDKRAACLERAADAMQARMPVLLGLMVREAGKALPAAIGEVREAVDFLRYYAQQSRSLAAGTRPLGPIACISPWNFPLSIFTGQVAAALAAGNPVLAKPAEETPLIAAESVRILHDAGVPVAALQLLPGDGATGAALVAAPPVTGVIFTGSTEVARLIQAQLAERLSPADKPIPLIAETGGQNAMIVDSSALAEQVVADVITSAFDSAGQRCSALRILCLQDEIADRTLAMLKGALAELRIGPTDRLAVDIGPVITAEAKANIEAHIAAMRGRGRRVEQLALPDECANGTFVPPTIIELERVAELEREVFGPVLHVVRYRRERLDALIDAINATGYGLTFGLHSRIDETVAHVTARVKAGNLYVNRNIIGAVVGVQPFGGRGLSGTGPKAGGPLYLTRLVKPATASGGPAQRIDPALSDLALWLDQNGERETAARLRGIGGLVPEPRAIALPGPVGECNLYELHPRGCILLEPVSRDGLLHQLAAALAAGNDVTIAAGAALMDEIARLPPTVRRRCRPATETIAGALLEGDPARIRDGLRRLARRPGPLVPAQAAALSEQAGIGAYRPEWLVEEIATAINTTAAGGNASLMTIA